MERRAELVADSPRLQALKDILTRQRNYELAKVRDFRRNQAEEKLNVPSDDLEVARSTADDEMHANLIERSEERLKAIDDAFLRLEQGKYGICASCGEEISLERLNTLPFAIHCVDCQQRREAGGRARGLVPEPFIHRWNIPEEMDESIEEQESLSQPEDDLTVRESAFGPDEEESQEALQRASGRRRRRRLQS